ncbi:lysophospholipid acyltransferase 1 isoform X2 [Carcharodon carcharias]|uniref:lysophospholipid acyltransferase 1 isoform X2 n=1 Tax=Carcharodon carcharias TaxID=13397 RepID=UPI001B7EAF6E|nr:lysophospholipid acyltransferase 1 isoform X2 [Carcharodon carcharias]
MAEPPSIPFRTTGSRLLHPLSILFNVPLDQVNFAVCQSFALFAAFWFRLYLSPSRAGAIVRHVVITMIGIYFAIFCFGWYSLHIFIEVSLCYCIMITASVSNIHRYSFVAAMGYLTLCQISRVYIFNYGLLATDFSGPLMIVTQKITSLAFQIHDGLGRKDEELTTEQRRLAVSARPTLLEYCSYHLNFLGILAGPTSSYKDYIAFIEGNHIDMKLIEEHWKQKGFSKFPDPSPLPSAILARTRELPHSTCPHLYRSLLAQRRMAVVVGNQSSQFLDIAVVVLQDSDLGRIIFSSFINDHHKRAVANKMLITFICLVWFTVITKNFPISYNVDDKFISEASFFRKLCYLFISVHASRPKYYFAWTLADAINNAAGFGFSGLDKNGNLRWNLISNLNIWNIETATSFKMCLDSWNIQTGAWLKSVCYDRAPYFPTALTFILSALWHGVYPGYYFTFTTAILITLAARAMRSNFRHYFLSSRMIKVGYDIATWASTQLALCYIVTPFLLLATEPTIKFYNAANSGSQEAEECYAN